MLSWGLLLLILGAGTFVLKMFNMQFKILSFLDAQTQTIVAVVMAAAGAVLIVLSFVIKKPPAKIQQPPQNPPK